MGLMLEYTLTLKPLEPSILGLIPYIYKGLRVKSNKLQGQVLYADRYFVCLDI